jgi:site-specific DNA-methyltransferase (adenine-specific)
MTYNPQYIGEQKNKNQQHKENNRDKSTKTSDEYKLKRNINKGAFPKNVLTFDFDKDRLHPTQKPLELLEYLIKTYTNEGDIVLDNTMGSGTTNLACIKLNRKSIGIEKEKQYYDVAVRRASEYCH